jgi:hypothetical protein
MPSVVAHTPNTLSMFEFFSHVINKDIPTQIIALGSYVCNTHYQVFAFMFK